MLTYWRHGSLVTIKRLAVLRPVPQYSVEDSWWPHKKVKRLVGYVFKWRTTHYVVKVGHFRDSALTLKRSRQIAEQLARKALLHV